jgi:hypothetical protein
MDNIGQLLNGFFGCHLLRYSRIMVSRNLSLLSELEIPLRLLFRNWGTLDCFERVVDCGVDEDWQVAEVYCRVDCRLERWNMTCSHDSELYNGFGNESV